jgi:hypothetical protein
MRNAKICKDFDKECKMYIKDAQKKNFIKYSIFRFSNIYQKILI